MGPPEDPLWTAAHQRWALILLAGVLGVLWAAATPPGALWALGSFTGASLESPRAIPQAATEQSENSHRPPRRRCPAALPIHEERNPGRMTDHPNSDRAPERTQIVVMSFRELQGAPAGSIESRHHSEKEDIGARAERGLADVSPILGHIAILCETRDWLPLLVAVERSAAGLLHG